mgnify:FL=1
MIIKNMIIVFLLLLIAPGIVFSHHSVSLNFDQSEELTLTGKLTKISWRNPHSHFRLEVLDENGVTTEWLIEMGALNTMKRVGFKMEHFVILKPISITGWEGVRNNSLFLLEATLHNGIRLICAGASCSQER